jgi:meso-butanediol dehydrogenase/(S,S)-butanediol dehydrogenase/diacetyl reductase
MKLEGKVALVTGAGRQSGLGRGIALALANEGADVAVVDTDIVDSAFNQYGTKEVNGFQDARKLAEEIQGLGRKSIAVKADVTKWDQVQAMVQQTIDGLGKVDILVNNAGVISVELIQKMEEEAWDLMMNVNVKGIFLGCKAVIPHMIEQNFGRIINTASIAGKSGFATLGGYCASKYAVVGFTNSLGKELAPYDITVNALCPGIIRTAMWDLLADLWKQGGETTEESWERHLAALIPQGRGQTPEEMGKMVVFLATANEVTAQAFNVDGGIQ